MSSTQITKSSKKSSILDFPSLRKCRPYQRWKWCSDVSAVSYCSQQFLLPWASILNAKCFTLNGHLKKTNIKHIEDYFTGLIEAAICVERDHFSSCFVYIGANHTRQSQLYGSIQSICLRPNGKINLKSTILKAVIRNVVMQFVKPKMGRW